MQNLSKLKGGEACIVVVLRANLNAGNTVLTDYFVK